MKFYVVLTVEIPWVELMEIERGDDVRLAREVGSLAMEEVDDELFIGGEESEAWREVGTVVYHAEPNDGCEEKVQGLKHR